MKAAIRNGVRCASSLAIVLSLAAGAAAREVVTVPLPTAGRTPLVEVLIDGGRSVRLMVDPGNDSAIDEIVAKELGLSPDSSGKVELANLSVGGVELGSVQAVVWPMSSVTKGGARPDGYLAISVFEEYLLTLDYPNQRLTLEDGQLAEPDGQDILSYALNDESAMTLPAVIGGVSMDIRFDAGAVGDFALPTSFMKQLSLVSEPSKMGESISPDGTTAEILGARLDGAASIGGHVFERPGLEFSEAFSRRTVGYDLLAHMAMTFDQKSQRIRLVADANRGSFLQQQAAQLPSLEEGAPSLQDFFNANSEKVHLMVLLSPT